MTIEKFCENFPSGDNSSEVVRKLVSELIQEENKEEILTFWCDEGDTADGKESKPLYYIVTDKRFFEIYVDSDSFGYRSYFLNHLSSLKEEVISDRKDSYGIMNSSYFSDGNEGVETYKVEFSFSVSNGKSDEAFFSLSTSSESSDKKRIRFKKLRSFVKEFYKVVSGL